MIQLQPGQTLVFDGDSLTALRSAPTLDQWPWLRITNNHRSWADVFSELLFAWRPDLQLKYRTAAVGGSTSLDLEERFESTIAVLKPDWIFMTLASNDASRQIDPATFEGILRTYATRVNEWGGQVVFLHNLLACIGASAQNQTKESLRKPYYDIEARLAAELHNVQLIDIGTPLKEKAAQHYAQYEGHSVYSDGTHLSHLGAMIVAGEVLKACGILQSPE
ncbi:GDSL-type esterase/lipase family protein [Kiritimatiellaeota bacterium B1221]|nr:GDSL-type esterase/lipase family protein [Kiritimatiellaeota bacterium B1221]